MPALTYGKSKFPIVGPTRGSRYRIRRCGRADFSKSGLELARAPMRCLGVFANATISTISTDRREDKAAAGDSNGPGFKAPFQRRLRFGVIGFDASGVV